MTGTRDVVIRAEGLSKRYAIRETQRYKTLRESLTTLIASPVQLMRRRQERFWALRDVSFEVARGEIVGIIGRNGAGKSTLLKVLSRITEPTEGRAVLFGRVGSLLEVGTGFHLELSGRENIFLSGAILGLRRREILEKFNSIVEFAEVERFIDTPVKRYSSGMYLRLAFSVAAHLDPEILLVDEVLAVGDAAFQKKCLGKMGEAAGEGRTVVFVSHNMSAVERLCQRCILLEKGRVSHIGESREVIDQYLAMIESAEGDRAPGEVDLSRGRSNQYGDGSLIIRKVRLVDATGASKETFRMGQALTVEVELEGLSSVRDGIVGVTFKSRDGQWLASLNTAMSCQSVEEPRSTLEVARLRLSRVPFTPGLYSISVSVTQGQLQRLDFADLALQFTVVGSDVYGTGYEVAAKYGVVYLDGTWEIVNG